MGGFLGINEGLILENECFFVRFWGILGNLTESTSKLMIILGIREYFWNFFDEYESNFLRISESQGVLLAKGSCIGFFFPYLFHFFFFLKSSGP